MIRQKLRAYKGLIIALAVSNLVNLSLFGLRTLGAENFRYWFLIWNLFLAWLPVLWAFWLVRRLASGKKWLAPLNILLTLLWVSFLPNSFYLVSDLIHLQSTGEINVLFDAVLFSSFIFNGFVAGFLSVYIIHRQLIKHKGITIAHGLIGLVFLACGFAIYLGRSMRWNSWDVVLHPLSLLFDVSDPIINPLANPQLFVTTLTFFVFLTSIYFVFWQALKVAKTLPKD